MNENNTPLDEGLGLRNDDSLQITDEITGYWKETGRWGQFFAVLLFVYLVIAVIALIAMLFVSSDLAGLPGMAGGIVSVMALGGLAFSFFLAMYHWKFGTELRNAIQFEENGQLETAFDNLKKYFRLYGYVIVGVILLYILAIVVGIGAFIGRGM